MGLFGGGIERRTKMKKIVSKQNWEDVQAGDNNRLNFIEEKQLRHLFGDDYEEHIIRIWIEQEQTEDEWIEDDAGIGEREIK